MKAHYFLLLILVLFSCKKNLSPTVSIISPNNNAIFPISDSINVSLDASDPDGFLTDVILLIDGQDSISLEPPYLYTIKNEEVGLGGHILNAFAIDDDGSMSEDELLFIVYGVPAVVKTSSVDSISENSAIITGEVVDDGGLAVTERGVCWSKFNEPTIEDEHIASGDGVGVFSVIIDNLSSNTEYFFRAYAENDLGTTYGVQLKAYTLRSVITLIDIDGNAYQAIKIGDQIWMEENLKTTHYADGSEIPYIFSDENWKFLDPEVKAYCWYGDTIINKDDYGALYTWAAAMNGQNGSVSNPGIIQGVCPDGWHLPSDSEWQQLEIFLGMSEEEANATGFRGTDEGGKLKEEKNDHWQRPNTGATNESGFTALPSGLRTNNGDCVYLGRSAFFITSTEGDKYTAWLRFLTYGEALILREKNYKNSGLSVRCVKDQF